MRHHINLNDTPFPSRFVYVILVCCCRCERGWIYWFFCLMRVTKSLSFYGQHKYRILSLCALKCYAIEPLLKSGVWGCGWWFQCEQNICIMSLKNLRPGRTGSMNPGTCSECAMGAGYINPVWAVACIGNIMYRTGCTTTIAYLKTYTKKKKKKKWIFLNDTVQAPKHQILHLNAEGRFNRISFVSVYMY